MLSIEQIVKSCQQSGGYKTAELNSILYLNYMGIIGICTMPGYSPKCIWLNGNGISLISNLMPSVTCLYLQNNAISVIHGLMHLVNLKELNLSSNLISALNDELPVCLQSLYISKNLISESAGLSMLSEMVDLSTLDISDNQIKDQGIVEVLGRSTLKVINVEGNPVLKSVQNFRKSVIAKLPSLMNFNSKPVEPDERLLVKAFFNGGKESEQEQRCAMLRERTLKNQNQFKSNFQ